MQGASQPSPSHCLFLLWLRVGNTQISLIVPHNLIKNLKTPQKAITTSFKDEEHRICAVFSLWLSLSNWFHLAPVSFLFAFFSDEKGTRCHVHSWKQKWNYSHFFHAFLSPGVETTPTARLSPRHLERHSILEVQKVHLSKWWWSRFKTFKKTFKTF